MKTTKMNYEVCHNCRGKAPGRIENYAYTECGLKNIVLANVMVYRCERCGETSVDIPNVDGLHRCVALLLLRQKRSLRGDEIRFLRGVAGLTATALARSMGASKISVSRWENSAKPIGAQSDKVIRMICGLSIIKEIVESRSGAVQRESIDATMDVLKDVVSALESQGPEGGKRKTDEGEPERLLIDPMQPSGAVPIPMLSENLVSLLQ